MGESHFGGDLPNTLALKVLGMNPHRVLLGGDVPKHLREESLVPNIEVPAAQTTFFPWEAIFLPSNRAEFAPPKKPFDNKVNPVNDGRREWNHLNPVAFHSL